MKRTVLLAVFGLALIAAACGGSTGSPTPSASPGVTPTPPATPGPSDTPDVAATWWVDPLDLPLKADQTVIRGLLVESSCASGQSPERRVLEPTVEYRADAVVVTYAVTPRPGGQDCQGNPEFAVVLTLTEPLGGRALLDGSVTPPRDATAKP